jgi:hypothetical protein
MGSWLFWQLGRLTAAVLGVLALQLLGIFQRLRHRQLILRVPAPVCHAGATRRHSGPKCLHLGGNCRCESGVAGDRRRGGGRSRRGRPPSRAAVGNFGRGCPACRLLVEAAAAGCAVAQPRPALLLLLLLLSLVASGLGAATPTNSITAHPRGRAPICCLLHLPPWRALLQAPAAVVDASRRRGPASVAGRRCRRHRRRSPPAACGDRGALQPRSRYPHDS